MQKGPLLCILTSTSTIVRISYLDLSLPNLRSTQQVYLGLGIPLTKSPQERKCGFREGCSTPLITLS